MHLEADGDLQLNTHTNLTAFGDIFILGNISASKSITIIQSFPKEVFPPGDGSNSFYLNLFIDGRIKAGTDVTLLSNADDNGLLFGNAPYDITTGPENLIEANRLVVSARPTYGSIGTAAIPLNIKVSELRKDNFAPSSELFSLPDGVHSGRLFFNHVGPTLDISAESISHFSLTSTGNLFWSSDSDSPIISPYLELSTSGNISTNKGIDFTQDGTLLGSVKLVATGATSKVSINAILQAKSIQIHSQGNITINSRVVSGGDLIVTCGANVTLGTTIQPAPAALTLTGPNTINGSTVFLGENGLTVEGTATVSAHNFQSKVQLIGESAASIVLGDGAQVHSGVTNTLAEISFSEPVMELAKPLVRDCGLPGFLHVSPGAEITQVSDRLYFSNGRILVHASRNLTILTSFGVIAIGQGTVAILECSKHSIRILSLLDHFTSSVEIDSQQFGSITVPMGSEVMIGKQGCIHPRAQSVRNQVTTSANQLLLVCAEVSPLAALGELRSITVREHSSIYHKIEKSWAALQQMTNRKGPFTFNVAKSHPS